MKLLAVAGVVIGLIIPTVCSADFVFRIRSSADLSSVIQKPKNNEAEVVSFLNNNCLFASNPAEKYSDVAASSLVDCSSADFSLLLSSLAYQLQSFASDTQFILSPLGIKKIHFQGAGNIENVQLVLNEFNQSALNLVLSDVTHVNLISAGGGNFETLNAPRLLGIDKELRVVANASLSGIKVGSGKFSNGLSLIVGAPNNIVSLKDIDLGSMPISLFSVLSWSMNTTAGANYTFASNPSVVVFGESGFDATALSQLPSSVKSLNVSGLNNSTVSALSHITKADSFILTNSLIDDANVLSNFSGPLTESVAALDFDISNIATKAQSSSALCAGISSNKIEVFNDDTAVSKASALSALCE